MNEKKNERKLLLAVACEEADDGRANYIVDLAQGSSVTETAFCMSVVIRCLVRDGVVKDENEVLNYIKRYLGDSQFAEVSDEVSVSDQ